jgi:SAM-dependent methyltransferase
MKMISPFITIDHRHQPQQTIAERLLLFLSRKPESDDYAEGTERWHPGDGLSQLCRAFPNFMNSFVGRDVLDFGCGLGYQAIALARHGARYVVGIEPNEKRLARARNLSQQAGLGQQVDFADRLHDRFKARFDLVISQNSMEHYPDPVATLGEIKSALKPGGTILMTFGPPWYAPYGSHMHFFTKVPWLNLLFDEKTVMTVRTRFRSDGAARYEDVESGLNKMTVAKFEKLIAESGLKITHRKYECIRGFDFLGKVPRARELFINNINCALSAR